MNVHLIIARIASTRSMLQEAIGRQDTPMILRMQERMEILKAEFAQLNRA